MRPLLVAPALVLAVSCGYPGDPLPPALNIPEKIADLRALQRGDRIRIEFTIPPLTTEGLGLTKVSDVELRVGPGGAPPFDIERWAASATRPAVPASGPGAVSLDLPVSGWVGQELFLAVRTAGPSGRRSVWSAVEVLVAVAPLPKPSDLRALSDPAGVRLEWSGRPPFRVYRREAEAKEFALLGTAPEGAYTDATAPFGKRFEYLVQSAIRAGAGEAESELSDPVAITPTDTFPPAVPSGLAAIAGSGSIELAWNRSTESDLGGYFVYRAEGDGELRKHTDRLPSPAFSDRAVAAGRRYRYAVTAVDAIGNESAASPPVEMVAP
ncbi:MAG TPA: hypothetical protein DEH78_09940 [Solibacterales bacterium]|nr:hypothetical protein [Bryobacterales bacterium]